MCFVSVWQKQNLSKVNEYRGTGNKLDNAHLSTAHRMAELRCDEQHRCMGLNSHGFSKVSVIDAAGVKQVEHK